MVNAMGRKLVCGVGLNDADYVVCPLVNGKRVTCKIYESWCGILKRCYNKKRLEVNPTYQGCIVCDEWLTFSNFKAWMEKQDWHGKQLDKDILVKGNKIYSPETCVFVDAALNLFLTDHASARGDWPIGVYFNNLSKKFISRCCNPFTNKCENLGSFDCPEKAHLTWKSRKHELACKIADAQSDSRVSSALMVRYA